MCALLVRDLEHFSPQITFDPLHHLLALTREGGRLWKLYWNGRSLASVGLQLSSESKGVMVSFLPRLPYPAFKIAHEIPQVHSWTYPHLRA